MTSPADFVPLQPFVTRNGLKIRLIECSGRPEWPMVVLADLLVALRYPADSLDLALSILTTTRSPEFAVVETSDERMGAVSYLLAAHLVREAVGLGTTPCIAIWQFDAAILDFFVATACAGHTYEDGKEIVRQAHENSISRAVTIAPAN